MEQLWNIALMILGIAILVSCLSFHFSLKKLKKEVLTEFQDILKKEREWNKELINTTEQNVAIHLENSENRQKQLYDRLMDNNTTIFNTLLNEYQSEFRQIKDSVLTDMEEKVKETSTKVTSRLDAYLHEEQKDIDTWIHLIENHHGEHIKRIELIESALNKYPSDRNLISLYVRSIKHVITSDNPIIRKQAIERLNRAARVFLDNCKAKDWQLARDIMNQALKLGNQFINEVENKRIEKHKDLLKKLEAKVNNFSSKKELTDQQLSELEQLDIQLDKNFMKQYSDLNTHYQSLSKQLLKFFADNEEDDDKLKQYNLNAVQAIQSAYQDFKRNEKTYKSGTNIQVLTSKLGGWDTKYLSMSAQVYFQSTYSEIFSKLNPEVKPQFTREMLNQSKKGLG